MDQSFDEDREVIEERHRNEILNLLKGFEFERKDMESRFRQELVNRERKVSQSDGNKFGLLSNEVFEERLQEERNEMEEKFDKEKEELLLKIMELEMEIKKRREDDEGCGTTDGIETRNRE